MPGSIAAIMLVSTVLSPLGYYLAPGQYARHRIKIVWAQRLMAIISHAG